MSLEADLLEAFEVHSPDQIRAILAVGASPVALIKGKTPVASLIEGYLRSDRFHECLRLLLDAGATTGDPLIEAVLLDDDKMLGDVLVSEGNAAVHRRVRVPSAFTSCEGVTPLHVCAEFNSVRCARMLIEAGADVNAVADLDQHGFGGQTPVFHAVNSIHNYCRPLMELLVEAGAGLETRIKGLVWGKDAPWETLILDVTPLSYAQCGAYAQFHRREEDTYSNLDYLYRRRFGVDLPRVNVPNTYLSK
ncbi:MAG: ankyrin repeat domain-containing protein [Gemmatimonadaceae bacterium]